MFNKIKALFVKKAINKKVDEVEEVVRPMVHSAVDHMLSGYVILVKGIIESVEPADIDAVEKLIKSPEFANVLSRLKEKEPKILEVAKQFAAVAALSDSEEEEFRNKLADILEIP